MLAEELKPGMFIEYAPSQMPTVLFIVDIVADKDLVKLKSIILRKDLIPMVVILSLKKSWPVEVVPPVPSRKQNTIKRVFDNG